MMRARDGGRSRNPIHTDPEAARRAGLEAPIAAGAHVLAFVQQALMEAWGAESLLHGSHTDVRWLAPVHAESRIEPRATVSARRDDRLEVDLEVGCEGRTALTGTLTIPLTASGRGAPSA